MMTDKEVGELWHSLSMFDRIGTLGQLIRKLVEERAKRYGWKSPSLDEADTIDALRSAFRDFGIDSKEWPDE